MFRFDCDVWFIIDLWASLFHFFFSIIAGAAVESTVHDVLTAISPFQVTTLDGQYQSVKHATRVWRALLRVRSKTSINYLIGLSALATVVFCFHYFYFEICDTYNFMRLLVDHVWHVERGWYNNVCWLPSCFMTSLVASCSIDYL